MRGVYLDYHPCNNPYIIFFTKISYLHPCRRPCLPTNPSSHYRCRHLSFVATEPLSQLSHLLALSRPWTELRRGRPSTPTVTGSFYFHYYYYNYYYYYLFGQYFRKRYILSSSFFIYQTG